MKRFYCTICKKVKRVRKLPADAERHYDGYPPHKNVESRTGTCTRHSDLQRRNSRGISASQFINKVKGGR